MVQTKSRHHKTENTHRFLTLAERLANLNIDVVKRINRYNLKPEVYNLTKFNLPDKNLNLVIFVLKGDRNLLPSNSS